MLKLKKRGYGKSLIHIHQNLSLFLTQMPWRKMMVMKAIDVSADFLFTEVLYASALEITRITP